MTAGDIYKSAYKLKVFQQWQLIEELMKDWDFLGRSFVKIRVESWLINQLKHKTIIKVSKNPVVFALPEFADKWQEYIKKQTCLVCNKNFIPKNSQEKYCSEACKGKAEYQQKKEYKKQYLKQRKDLVRKASRNYTKKLQSMTKSLKRGKWSKEELTVLQTAHIQKGKLSKKDILEIAQKLGRSFKSVEHKYFSEVRK